MPRQFRARLCDYGGYAPNRTSVGKQGVVVDLITCREGTTACRGRGSFPFAIKPGFSKGDESLGKTTLIRHAEENISIPRLPQEVDRFYEKRRRRSGQEE